MSKLKLRIFDKNGTEIVRGFNTNTGLEEGNFYMKKVSVGLFETDTLIFLNDNNGSLSPLSQIANNFILNQSKLDDANDVLGGSRNFLLNRSELNSQIFRLGNIIEAGSTAKSLKVLLFIDTTEQEDLRFFTVNKNGEITWTNKILVSGDISQDIGVHIAFMGEKEGTYENKIYICETITAAQDPNDILDDEDITPIGTINVHSYAIGEDTRYRYMFGNFGIPDPITYLDIFKDENSLEDTDNKSEEILYEEKNNPNYHKYDGNMDYDFLNKESKKLFLTYHEIFPYAGTYKALINAINYLGYTDIYFKEWFKELPTSAELPAKTVSYEISYKNPHSILASLPLERKMSLKKLNWLSMIYKISEYALDNDGNQKYEYLDDNVQIPITKSNYSAYNADEILIKLIGLKNWLEKYIIGLNCRIIEINGEGICVERYKHRIYGKTTIGSLYYKELSVTPFTLNKSEDLQLINSSCNIKLSMRELYEDADFKSKYKSILFNANLTTKNGIIPVVSNNRGFVDIPIIIKDGEICFDSNNLNGFSGMEANFKKLPIIQIEKANLRRADKPWNDPNSIAYKIYKKNKKYIVNSDDNEYSSYITLYPNESTTLKYTANNIFNIPLFIFNNYDGNIFSISPINNEEYNDEYILELLDGKMVFNDDIVDYAKKDNNGYQENKTFSLNFNFDDDNLEQNIELNYSYSKEVNINDIPEFKDITENTYLTDMVVNNTGDYRITCVVTDEYNNFYANNIFSPVSVYAKDPDIVSITLNSNANNSEDFFNKSEDGKIYPDNKIDEYIKGNESGKAPENYLLNNVSVKTSEEGNIVIKYASYPTLSYAVNTPKNGDIAHFMNISDSFEYIGRVEYEIDKNGATISKTYGKIPGGVNTSLPAKKLSNYGLSSYASKYTIIWVKRNDAFAANIFSYKNSIKEGVIDTEYNPSDDTFTDVNIVFYDKINGRPIFQETCKMLYCYVENTPYHYIISQTDLDTSMYAYYFDNDGKMCVGRYTTDSKKVKIVSEEDNSLKKIKTVNDILSSNGYIQIFVQSVAEIKLNKLEKIENKIFAQILRDVSDDFVRNHNNTHQKAEFIDGDKLKIKYAKELNKQNILYYSSAYNCIDGSFIKTKDENDKEINAFNINLYNGNIYNGNATEKMISRAHNAFVDYNFDVNYAIENNDGTTSLYVKNEGNLDYVDRTFSISVRDFDMDNIRKYWDSEKLNTKYYAYYNTPVTLESNNGKIIIGLSDGYINFNTSIVHTLWELYKFDKYKNKNELLLKSWNSALCLNIPDTGIYSVKLSLFDEYGNFIEKTYEGVLKIIDTK